MGGDKFDEAKDKAVREGAEQAEQRVDDVAQKADEATGGKASGATDKGEEKAREGLDKLQE